MLDQLNTIAANTSKPVEDFESIRNEYFSYLARKLEAHTIRGFSPQVGGGNVISLPLSKIFVPLKAVEGRPPLAEYAEEDLLRQAVGEVNSESEGGLDWELRTHALERRFAQLKISQEAEKSLTLADLLQSPRAILLGHPGTGKTTITRYVTYSLAVNDLRHIGIDLAGRVPVLIRIANFAKAYEQDSTLHIVDYVAKDMTGRPEFGNYLRWAIEQNSCFVILDGLDEISDTNLRIRVTDHIQNMVASFSGNHYLVTSRIIGYDHSPLTQEFRHATLQELTDDDKFRFVQLWYDAIQSKISSEAHGRGADDLITALRNKPQISRMAANPLLLTIMVLMHWRGTKLPSRRVQVYQTATDTLVEYWSAQREGVDLDAEEIKNILAPIAHYILSSNVSGVIAHQDLLPRFYQGVVKERGCSQEEARRIGREMLKNLNEQSGLFLERGVDANNQPVYGFLHQTFGEYLAALHLAHNIQENCFSLKDYIHNSIWYEPLLLLLGHLALYSRPQANLLTRQILDYPASYDDTLQRNLHLAADCLGDDIQIEPSLRDEILEKLAELVQHPVPQLRDAVIERYQSIAVTRHRDAAIAALKKYCDIDDKEKLNKLSRNTRFDLAKALIYLKELQVAQSIVWQLDDENYGDRIRRLRFENWPELAADYLLQLKSDNEYDFAVTAGKDLANSNIGPVNAELARRVLGEENFIKLITQLSDRFKDGDDKAILDWIAVLGAENTSEESLLTLLQANKPNKIRRFAATKLLNSKLHAETAEEVLQNLAFDTPEEANVTVEAFLETGRKRYVDTQFLRDSAIYASFGNSGEAIINLLKLGDIEFAVPVVFYYFANCRRNWKIVKSLLDNDFNDVGVAIAELLALWPGYSYRWEACQALIEVGQVDKVIPLLQFLAYECHDQDSNKAIQKLIMLDEIERVKPLLYSMAYSTTTSIRYQGSMALAKTDSPPLSDESSVPNRIDLKINVFKLRTEALKAAIKNLCQVGKRVLAELNSTDEQVVAVRDLAYYSLTRFAVLNGVSVDIPKVELIDLLNSTSSIVRLRSSLYNIEGTLADRIHRIVLELLNKQGSNISLQAQALALSLYCCYSNTTDRQPVELIKFLTNPNATMRRGSAFMLGLLGESSSVSILISGINDRDRRTRAQIARGLSFLGDSKAVSPLIMLLNSEREAVVRKAAIEALGKIGDIAAIPHLTKVLTDVDLRVRRSAIRSLSLFDTSTIIPVLIAALQNDDSIVRALTTYLLGESGEPSVVHALVTRLKNDEDKTVRSLAAHSLGELADQSAVPVLIDSLKDRNHYVRYHSAVALGKLGDMVAVTPLNSILTDKKELVRNGALRAFRELGVPFDVEAIVGVLKDRDPEKRWAAVHILSVLKLDVTFEHLVTLLNDEDVVVRHWVNWGLGLVGNPDGIKFLLNSLTDEEAIVRRSAVGSLGQLGDYSVLSNLLEMLGDSDSSVRNWAVWALGQIGDSVVSPKLMTLLNDNNKDVRASAARSLGQLGAINAVDSLGLALDDPEKVVCRAAANSLGKLGDPIVIPYLMREFATERFRALARMKVSDVLPRILFTLGSLDENGERESSFSLVHLAPDVALTYLERCRRIFSKKSWIPRLRGQALWELGDTKAAIKGFHEAFNISSFERENKDNLITLVHYYLEQGELQQAVDYSKRAVLYLPNSDICLLTYAVVLWLKGDAEIASDQLKKAKIQNRHITNVADLQFDYFWRDRALLALKALVASDSARS